MLLQEEIHLRFCLKFAMVSCDKLVYKICVNRWCNLVPRLLVPSMGKTGLARYSRGDGEAFVQDLWHLHNALNGTEENAVFDENIPEQKKQVKTRKWTTNLRQTARKKTSNKINPDHTIICYCFNLLRKFFLSKNTRL